MSSAVTRLSSIEIKNFKNVVFGHLDFENAENYEQASALGLYGPNGSGKTVLIDALDLLRHALTGIPLAPYFADYINIDSQKAELKYEFKILNSHDDSVYTVSYQVNLGRVANSSGNTTNITYKPVLFDEVLSCLCESGSTTFHISFNLDTLTDFGQDKCSVKALALSKLLAFTSSRSFIFSKKFLDFINSKDSLTKSYHKFILDTLGFFGNFQLFVIKAGCLDKLSLSFDNDKNEVQLVNIDLNGTTFIPEQGLNLMKNKIDGINGVLQQLIPNISIGAKTLSSAISHTGQAGYNVRLMCNKNGKEFPLQYESAGIKKLISILPALILTYNDPSITVAIDELDYDIFEYLLGELISIISYKGCGQLIFTAHNLRPMETLDKRFIACTTTNPQNRYVNMSHLRVVTNLRDFYYRDIILGEQSESVYEPTNNSSIALAFLEAGNSMLLNKDQNEKD